MAKKFSLALTVSMLVCSCCVAASAPLTVTSPDGNLSVSLEAKIQSPTIPAWRAPLLSSVL